MPQSIVTAAGVMRALPRRRAMALLGGAALAAAIPRARAQAAYPDRPIKLVVPFAPGGGFDAIGRQWADHVRPSLGAVVVENISGGGSSLGAASVARATPDGYTLLLAGSGALVVNPLASARKLYDPLADFLPTSLTAIHCFALAVHPGVPAKTLGELLAYARSNPEKMAYGSAGTGSLNHLTGELFKTLTGLRGLLHVPYRGAGPAMNDVISGHVPMIVPSMNGQMIELHRAGKARILAVTSPERLKGAPDIPTAVEAGVAGMVSQNYVGVFAPAQTPPEIIAKLVEANAAVLKEPRWQQQLQASGFEAVPDTRPAHATEVLKAELARWAPVIQSIGLKLD